MLKCSNCDTPIKEDYTIKSNEVCEQIYCEDCYNELFTDTK